MKHLLLLLLFSGSLDSFSQGKDTTKQWNIFGDLNLQEPARFEIDNCPVFGNALDFPCEVKE